MSSELQSKLLVEVDDCQSRLHAWLDEAPVFGKPLATAAHDATFKARPLYFVEIIVGHSLVRADWNLKAIACLCREGMAVQAQPILRALLESAIDLRYISTNPQALVTKWTLHEEALHYVAWKDRPRNERPDGFGFSEREVERRLKQLDKHVPKRHPWKASDLARDWDLSNLAERDKKACAALQDGDFALYGFYKLLCGSLHGGTQAANDFVVSLGDGKFATVEELPERKQVFVLFTALLAQQVNLAAAHLCGAVFAEDLGPRWDAIGANTELADAAVLDFKIASYSSV